MTKLIFIDEIDFDKSPKVRHEINNDVVDHYAEQYSNKKKLPPIHVFISKKGERPLIADGWHRSYAKTQLGIKGIDAEVHEGGYIECMKFALTANSYHGLPRSNADKRKCVRLALMEWFDKTNVFIAELADVNDKLVAEVRAEMEAEALIAKTETRTSRDGKRVPASRSSAKSEPRESEAEPEPEEVKVASAVDCNGIEIPKAVLMYWERTPEVKAIIAEVSDIMDKLKLKADSGDPMFQSINIPAAIGDLDNVRRQVALAIPYCVCPQCQGHPEIQPKEECRLCGTKGLISKFIWDRAIPEETKKMITNKK
jgi:hypothetical protein